MNLGFKCGSALSVGQTSKAHPRKLVSGHELAGHSFFVGHDVLYVTASARALELEIPTMAEPGAVRSCALLGTTSSKIVKFPSLTPSSSGKSVRYGHAEHMLGLCRNEAFRRVSI